MSLGKALRLRRVMARGRAVVVAMDHGNAAGVVRGLEQPLEIVKIAARHGADGILVTPGLLEQTADEAGDLAILLRIDGAATSFGPGGPMRVFCPVEEALRLGADAVVVNATLGAEHESEELEKVGHIATEGRRWGVPVIAEMLSQRMLGNHMDFSGQGDAALPGDIAKDVAAACRIGVELGADAVKTRYPASMEGFRRAVLACGRPVFAAGGPLRDATLEATLRLVDEAMQAGASGVIFGRQIWQHPDPAEALRAVCAIVHEDLTVDEALHGALA